MEYEYYRLENGIRLIHKEAKGTVGHLGVVLNTGSRDELETQHGIAHFIEHVIFKGTKKRKAYHVISRLEDVGGEIDAYTTKEETCIYAAFMNRYYDRAMELFADIIFNSSFPEKELEKEKEVIIDEINSYKDSPAELIFDDFEDLIFKGHAIGRNILGEPKQINKYKRKDIIRFIEDNYNTDQMVICSVGDIPFKKLVKWTEKWFGHQKANMRSIKREPLNEYKPTTLELEKDTHQTHCIIGNRAPAINHKQRISIELLNNILGGPGMNSRLNLALREKHGYTYNIESFYSAYSDTGLVGIYFGTEEEKLEKCLRIINKEIIRLQEKPLGHLQLDRAKKQMIGQMAIGAESKSNLMLNIGRSYLLFNEVDPLQKVYDKIEAISAQQLRDAANEVLDSKFISTLIYR